MEPSQAAFGPLGPELASNAAQALACGEYETSTATLRVHDRHLDGVRATRLLVRSHGQPLGYLIVPAFGESLDAGAVAEALPASWALAGTDATHPLPPTSTVRADPSPDTARGVAVVVCTRNRAADLADCLRSLQTLTYSDLEFLVVDNAPVDGTTRAVVAEAERRDPRFRYVVEPVAGLSRARNLGLEAAHADIVAFTDDDAQVSPDWIDGLVAAFATDPAVKCVTGLVASQRVTSEYERYFERRYTSWWTRMTPVLYDDSTYQTDALFPYSAGQFGTGANFAVDRIAAITLGGFDPALGAGSRAAGGEDLDLFARVLLNGYSLRYEPSAVVWHAHRADRRSLLRQTFHYGTGCSAYVTKLLVGRRTRREVLRRAPRGARHILSAMRGARQSAGDRVVPSLAVATELAGYVYGPLAYLLARFGSAPDEKDGL